MMHAADSLVPSPILEAFDGVFLLFLALMTHSMWRYVRRQMADENFWLRPWTWDDDTRAAWSIMLIFSGLLLRVGPHWLTRHAFNHGYHWPAVQNLGPVAVLVSTLITIWGCVCWIRAVAPPELNTRAWLLRCGFALTFGVYMALGGP